MASKIVTISLNKEQYDFVKSQPELSLSKVAQSAVREIMERHKIVYNDIEILQKKANKLQNYVQKLTKFLEDKGLWEEFLKNTDLGGII
ncbi:hypothetical protein ES703_61322 [subsurface metagenome]